MYLRYQSIYKKCDLIKEFAIIQLVGYSSYGYSRYMSALTQQLENQLKVNIINWKC